MAPNGTVVNNNRNSSCANLSNPYHQCSQACAQKTTKGGGGGRTKTHTNYNQNTTTTTSSVAGGGRREAKNSNQVARPTKSKTGCPKASNPYHNCDTNCNKTTHSVTAPDHSNFKRAAKPKPPPAVLNERAVPLPSSKSKSKSKSAAGQIYLSASSAPAPAPPSPPHHNNNNLEDPKTDNHHIIIAAEAEAEAEQQHLMITTNPIGTEDNDKVASSPDELLAAAAAGGPRDFSFSAGSNEEDEEEETESVISECRVPVGKYNVKESFGSILQSILDKYGDIGESCHLESVAMRTYYIECVCFVVQELQSSTHSITNSKSNELLSILKDVESAQIRVPPWLRIALDHNIQIQSLREQLESELEALALKEKEVDDIKNNRIPHIRDRLRFTEPNFTSTLPN